MTNVTTFEVIEGAIALVGNTTKEKMVHLVKQGSEEFILSVVNAKGAAGKAAREVLTLTGDAKIINAASHANYRPFAEKMAAMLQKAVTITNRASFESFPDRIQDLIAEAQAKPNKGLVKDGSKPTATVQRLMEAKAFAERCVREAAEAYESRRAAQQERQQNMWNALMAPARKRHEDTKVAAKARKAAKTTTKAKTTKAKTTKVEATA